MDPPSLSRRVRREFPDLTSPLTESASRQLLSEIRRKLDLRVPRRPRTFARLVRTPAQTCHNDGRDPWHYVPQPQQKHTVRPLSSRQNSEPRCRLVHFGSPPHRHRQRQRDMRLARREQASTAPRSWRSRERDLAICFWSVRLREPGRNKQSRTPRPTQRRVHGSQLDMYRWL